MASWGPLQHWGAGGLEELEVREGLEGLEGSDKIPRHPALLLGVLLLLPVIPLSVLGGESLVPAAGVSRGRSARCAGCGSGRMITCTTVGNFVELCR